MLVFARGVSRILSLSLSILPLPPSSSLPSRLSREAVRGRYARACPTSFSGLPEVITSEITAPMRPEYSRVEPAIRYVHLRSTAKLRAAPPCNILPSAKRVRFWNREGCVLKPRPRGDYSCREDRSIRENGSARTRKCNSRRTGSSFASL